MSLNALMARSRGLVVVVGLAGIGCEAPPAPAEAYLGEPVRAALDPDCGPNLRDANDQACVAIDVFSEGQGEAAAKGEWIKLHYIVQLPDGTELDSSHDRKPLVLRLGSSADVIEGLHLGALGMRIGERRRIVVPPPLGYRGRKLPGIPPDANLTFFVELIERKPA